MFSLYLQNLKKGLQLARSRDPMGDQEDHQSKEKEEKKKKHPRTSKFHLIRDNPNWSTNVPVQ